MDVIIAEKSIAGKRIASILAGKDVPEKSEHGARVFEFEENNEKKIVIPLRGHVVDVDFPKSYAYWLGTDLKKLIGAQILYIDKEKEIIEAIKQIAKKTTRLIIATDADREGESIGLEAINAAKQSNPEIEIKRSVFSAITPKDIKTAFSNLVDVDYNLANSADSRREIDLAWGAVVTRFLSLMSGRLGKEFLSAGRVQTPVLALIVDREKERLAFKVQKYWVLSAIFDKDGHEFLAEHQKGKFWEKEEAEKIFAKKSETGTVVKIKKAERVLARPTPFNTTTFLRAATALGYSAGEAMNIAESLYQSGYTSYPRTDNAVYPPNLSLKEILDELVKGNEFRKEAEKILAMKALMPSKGKESKDHPPIHPVSAAPRTKLSERQWKIYELVVRRFLATLAEDAITENTSVQIEMNKEIFIARGQTIVKSGWKEFYYYSQLTEVILPKLEEKDILKLKKLNMEEKETTPPARFSQGSLIKLMEELNLGTKSTRADILQKLYYRQYITGLKALEPTKLSFAVIDSLEKYAKDLTKSEMTAELEKEMDLIAAGKKTKVEVVEDSKKFLSIVLDELLKNKDKISLELRKGLHADSMLGKCDKCDGNLRMLVSKNKKRFLGCTNYPKCTNTYPLPQKGRLIPLAEPCKHCGKPAIQVIGSRYRFSMCLDPNCVSKEEWKARAAEKKAKAEELAKSKQVQGAVMHSKETQPKMPTKEKISSKEAPKEAPAEPVAKEKKSKAKAKKPKKEKGTENKI